MRTSIAFALTCLCGSSLAGAGTAQADGFSIRPGSAIYSYESPASNFYAALQVGPARHTAAAIQTGGVNVAVVTQIGGRARTLLVQGGQINGAFVSQFSHRNIATVVQFSPPFSLLMGP